MIQRHVRKIGDTGRQQRYARAALIIGLIALGLWIIQGFIYSLVWAGILGIALWPIYSRAVNAWPQGRHVALPAISTILVGFVFILPLLVIVVQVARDAHDFTEWLHTVERAGVPLPSWIGHVPFGHQIGAWWSDNLAKPFDSNDVLSHVNRTSVVQLTREIGERFTKRLVVFLFTLLTLFFMFRDGRTLAAELLEASHRLFGARGEHIARQMATSVHGTVDGLVLVGLGEGLAMGIAYYFTGVPHAVLLGAVTAVAAMIPFGAIIAFGAASIFLVAQGAIVQGIVVFGIGLVVLGIADHLVRPMVIGGATKLPFLWVLFGILGGVETFGLLGLFLGPAVMSALILLWRELIAARVPETEVETTKAAA